MSDLKMVSVPDIGNFHDVSVIDVMVSVGEKIEVDCNLITLETDKAAMDVPSPFSGTVREIKVKSGDKVSKGSVILLLEIESGNLETVSSEILQNKQSDTVPPPIIKPAIQNEIVTEKQASELGSGKNLPHASPAIRHLAHELGVDLLRVSGSGEKGRITREDVQNYVKAVLQQPENTDGIIDYESYGAVEIRALTRIQKISGPRLHRSWVDIPHVTQFDEADISDLEAFRIQLGKEYPATKITLMAFLVKAVAAALQKFPEFNASLGVGGENLILKKYFNIGVAVETSIGLMVPVLREVQNKGIVQLARELGEISARAREKKLAATEMQGGCFTITSLGGIGGMAFTPIINAPEVAILGVSRACMKPVWKDGQFVPRLMLPLSLSYDHRVIDGAQGARFSVYLAQLLADLRRLTL